KRGGHEPQHRSPVRPDARDRQPIRPAEPGRKGRVQRPARPRDGQGRSSPAAVAAAGFGGCGVNLKEIVQHCESPIETMLALAIADRFSDLEDAGMILTPLPPMEYESYERLPAEGLAFLIPQAVVDGADLRH